MLSGSLNLNYIFLGFIVRASHRKKEDICMAACVACIADRGSEQLNTGAIGLVHRQSVSIWGLGGILVGMVICATAGHEKIKMTMGCFYRNLYFFYDN